MREALTLAVLAAMLGLAALAAAQWFDGPSDRRPTPQIERTHDATGGWIIATQRGTRRVNIYIRRNAIHGLTVHDARENPAFNTPFVNINLVGHDYRFDVKTWEDGVSFCRDVIDDENAPPASPAGDTQKTPQP